MLAAALPAAQADPGYYVVTAYEQAGQVTLETRYWDARAPGRKNVAWPEAMLSVGVNSRWTTGLLWSWEGPSRGPFDLATFNWINELLLTQGNWPVDVALHTQWVHDHEDPGGGAFEWGPVLQTDFGRTQVNLNLVFVRGVGHDSAHTTTLKMQSQLRYRWQHGLHVGAQAFAEVGPWDHWLPHGRQGMRAGPAVFSTLHGAGTLELSAALLRGRTYGRFGHMMSLRAAVSF